MIETFCSYMERVLYEKEKGYYLKENHPASNIDYITASSHPLFILSIEKFIRNNFKDLNIVFLDVGAGDGSFLKNLKKRFSKEKIKFIAIDKIKRFEDKEILFLNSIDKIEKINGIIFSFELFDSLPFHLIEKKDGEIKEIYVENNNFIFSEISSNEIVKYIKRFKIKIEEGQRIEVCLLTEKIYEKMIKKLKSGFLLTFDYGFKSNILYKKSIFPMGTLITHKEKKWGREPLLDPYERDITYAINFSALIKKGEEKYLKTIAFTSMSKFIVENLKEELKDIKNIEHPIPSYDLIFGKVGQDIKVLIQKRF